MFWIFSSCFYNYLQDFKKDLVLENKLISSNKTYCKGLFTERIITYNNP